MEFSPTILKVEYHQLNYRIRRLVIKLNESDTLDPDYERAKEMLQYMQDYRDSLRYFCNINNVKI